MSEKWFAVRLILESRQVGQPKAKSLFEDRIVLVRSESADTARLKADRHARSEERTYANAEGGRVDVAFLEVLDCWELIDDKVHDLTEVYSTFLTLPELEQIRRTLSPMKNDELSPRAGRPRLSSRA